MIKGFIQQAGITLLSICAPNRESPKDTKQLLTGVKGEVNNNPAINSKGV